MIHETTLAVSRDNIIHDVEMLFRGWTDGSKQLITHYLSPIEFRTVSKFTGTDHELIEWVRNFPHKVGAIYVVTDHDVLYDMNEIRPELEFYRIVVQDADINIQKQNHNGVGQVDSRRESI